MKKLFVHWILVAAALALTTYLVPGVRVNSLAALLVAALVIGFLNMLLKPILVLLTLPITILTLGIFYFVLNAILFALAAWLVPGFSVAGFGSAFVGALVLGLTSWFLGWLLRDQKR